MGGYLSNELFIYTLKNIPSIKQLFSITFNSGSGIPAYYRNNPFDENFIMSHVLQFHVKGDALSMTQNMTPFGGVVNIPASSYFIIPNHYLSVFETYDFKQFRNFVDNGLNIPNPDQINSESQPETNITVDEDSNFDQAAPEPRIQEPITPEPLAEAETNPNTTVNEPYIHLPYFWGNP